MKYAIVLPDGAADDPVDSLGGRTPLEAAEIPNMDWVSENGRCGRVVTVPSGFLPGSDVATLSLLGYDPETHYDGRAPLEAAARAISVDPDQTIFRCNFVTVVGDTMEDFTAGHISQPEADRLVDDLNESLGDLGCRFHTGVSYRNLMIGAVDADASLKCTPPHDIPGLNVADYLPVGRGSDRVREIMRRGEALLCDHEINLVRSDMGENPATHIWLWGQGRPRPLKSLWDRFQVKGATIAAVDLIRGIAVSAGMDLIDVPGATGFLDTDYEAKGHAAVDALDRYELVVVHIEAPDEAGHLGNVDAKIRAIEDIDRCVVGPILQKLKQFDGWRILIAPDHPTPVSTRTHSMKPPPFCMAGTGIQGLLRHAFNELETEKSDLRIDPGHELLEFFLRA
ncbi:MAG: cofactor-independent phosphoglycerate mutase [Phycisphaerae bacterium]